MPWSLDLASSMSLSLEFRKLKRYQKFIIDFKNVKKVEPFGLLMISSQIFRLQKKYQDSNFVFSNYQNLGYPSHMGFFRAFGLDHGKKPGEAKGSTNYIPIKIFECEEIQLDAIEEGVYVGDMIEKECKNLATILCKTDSGDLYETLAYSLREIMRNVVEHSESKQFGICAQYWPTKSRVEFAIIDGGVGLKRTLENNPFLEVADDKSAINNSLMPAISGKAYKGAKNIDKGPWANSGFGLYMTSRICRNGGNFFIATGNTGMLLTSSGGKQYSDCCFDGTAVRMVIDTESISNLNQSLARFRSEGYEIQRTYKEIVNIDPSAASLMLSKDFDISIWKKLLKAVKLKKH